MLKKVKKKLRKIKMTFEEKKYNKNRVLTLEKICKLSEVDLPEEYKSDAKKVIPEICIAAKNLTPDGALFAFKFREITPEDIKLIQKNNAFVFAPKPIKGCKTIICKDLVFSVTKTLNYIRNLTNVKVITVTGSVGKTSTKEMIESVLKQKYSDNMLVSIGNSNSTSKVCLNIQKLRFIDKVYLQEVGAGVGHSIVKTSSYALEPDIAVYTNIKDSHIEWYGSRENIAKEKLSLSDNGKKNGLAIVNYDDDILRKHKFEQKRISYSFSNPKADYYAKNIKITSEGTSFTIVDTELNKQIDINLKVIGEHHVLNSLVGYIVGKYTNIKSSSIVKGIKSYRTTGGRQNLIDLGKYKVLADCYNSSYDAIASIMTTFDVLETKNNGKKIAVIGDIFELGKFSKEIHKKVGKLLTEHKIDKVIFQGEETKYAYDEYKKTKKNSVYCNSREELIKEINKVLEQDDIVLFKASHGMHFMELIDTIFGTDIGEQSAIGHREYEVKQDSNFAYKVFDNHVTVSEYKGKSKKIKLPEKLGNLPVEKLGKNVFENNKDISSVEISKNIVRLKGSCFKNSSLKEIKFNKDLKEIGPNAFFGCDNLTKVDLPNELLTVEFKAFGSCKNLKEIYIPESVMKISTKAFLDTDNVTILCNKNSYAETYAKTNEINYKIVK